MTQRFNNTPSRLRGYRDPTKRVPKEEDDERLPLSSRRSESLPIRISCEGRCRSSNHDTGRSAADDVASARYENATWGMYHRIVAFRLSKQAQRTSASTAETGTQSEVAGNEVLKGSTTSKPRTPRGTARPCQQEALRLQPESTEERIYDGEVFSLDM
uniref:Uncharacterized protein n=1 Tax=Grammatophora oceanica TaxID=210454 RepID=A0A7S1UV10_9STRA|mmetsp:Transcript_21028/g.31193  ORF Transcript_21028/g.31193 Transcript_21028/m.31193 type:complete len:158 (+) Transcript_21028:64-537(+)